MGSLKWFGAAALVGALAAPAATVQEWRFAEGATTQGWDAKRNHVSQVRVADGLLQGRIDDWDPWVTSPQFEIPASPYQAVEVRLKTDCGGQGELFWSNTTDTPYGGFTPSKHTTFNIRGDGEWHEYRIFPFWQAEKKIILLRLDLARPADQDKTLKTFAVEWIRVIELAPADRIAGPVAWDFTKDSAGWDASGARASASAAGAWAVAGAADDTLSLRSPLSSFNAELAGDWIAVEMAVDRGRTATLAWASATGEARTTERFQIKPDGRFHLYNVAVGGAKGWSGEVFALELQPSDVAGAEVQLRRVQVAVDPVGPAAIEVRTVSLDNAVNRAGRPLPFSISVQNVGGEACRGLAIGSLRLPDGVRLAPSVPGADRFPDIEVLDVATLTLNLVAERATAGEYALTLSGPGAPTEPRTGRLRIDAPLNLPKADYVPVPQPLASDYEIGALYFPGWPAIDRWARIWPTAPERKPVLGWYDEANPECIDWQIKWAVENGLSYFLVDWYWDRGGQHLDHWVKGFQKARYKSYLKWAMMWANHNREGSHSEEDQRAVTKFWIDNYFGTPEYYRINDMPVVMIWSPGNMNRDLEGKGGVKRLLEISREMARAAGYKGIWFVAMKWPEASTAAKDVQWLADAGFDMTSIYHYMHHGGKAENPRYFHFDLVAESSLPFWRGLQETGILPFLPNLATGWDDRPWHGDKGTTIHGRTVAHFRRICEDAKRFADESGVRRLTLAPLNEWGEGSYAEPCQEFGFGMYESVREVFCKQPAAGWPQNYAPADVGLGPYDLALAADTRRQEWDFSDGAQGWTALMGIGELQAADGLLVLKTASSDPALNLPLGNLWARRYSAVTIRLKVDQAEGEVGALQLFWSTIAQPVSEATTVSVPLLADGQFHDYVLPVGDKPRWRGRLTSFRLDPGSRAGLRVTIDRVALVPVAAE